MYQDYEESSSVVSRLMYSFEYSISVLLTLQLMWNEQCLSDHDFPQYLLVQHNHKVMSEDNVRSFDRIEEEFHWKNSFSKAFQILRLISTKTKRYSLLMTEYNLPDDVLLVSIDWTRSSDKYNHEKYIS